MYHYIIRQMETSISQCLIEVKLLHPVQVTICTIQVPLFQLFVIFHGLTHIAGHEI